MKDFIYCLILVIVGTVGTVYGLEAWDRSYWPNVYVVEQHHNVIEIVLDDKLTTNTDMAHQLAANAVLAICEDGYSVMIQNWSAVEPFEIVNLAMARRLANPDLTWVTTYKTLSNGEIHAYINAINEQETYHDE